MPEILEIATPYRVAGRRAPAPAAHLDQAWTVVVTEIRDRYGRHLPAIVGDGPAGPGWPAGPRLRLARPGETHDLRRDPAGTAEVGLAWLRAHGWAH